MVARQTRQVGLHAAAQQVAAVTHRSGHIANPSRRRTRLRCQRIVHAAKDAHQVAHIGVVLSVDPADLRPEALRDGVQPCEFQTTHLFSCVRPKLVLAKPAHLVE